MRIRRAVLLLWAAGLLLALVGLGSVPLRDWDEGIVARVALEGSRGLWPHPLLPSLWGTPYLNKPPGLHLGIGLVIGLWQRLGGGDGLPPAWVVRLLPALLSTLVIPLGAAIQGRLRRGDRLSAVATAALLATLLPVVRHGRLAMLDGSQLSAIALLWWCLLGWEQGRGAGRWRWAVGAGLAGSLLLLLKAPMLLPALAAPLLALTWGRLQARRRHHRPSGAMGAETTGTAGPGAEAPGAGATEAGATGTGATGGVATGAGAPLVGLLAGLALGLLPGSLWHLWHGLNRGAAALWLWGGDGAGRVLLAAGEGSDLGWRVPVLEVLEGGWPWLPLWPFALVLAWRQRHQPWGRWTLSLQLVLALAILPLRTQLPWYSHPLWLPFALLAGPLLAALIRQPQGRERPPGWRVLARLPLLWALLGGLALLLGLAAARGLPGLQGLRPLAVVLAAAGGGWLLGGLGLSHRGLSDQDRQRRQLGATALAAGSLVALGLLMASPQWLWELNETWSVEPAAALVRRHSAAIGREPLWIWQEPHRASLDWYAERAIQPLDAAALDSWPGGWLLSQQGSTHQQDNPDQQGDLSPQGEPQDNARTPALAGWPPESGWSCEPRAAAGGWQLLHCRPSAPSTPLPAAPTGHPSTGGAAGS